MPKSVGRARRRVDAAKRLEWMLREVRCMAKPGAETETLERLLLQEVERMRAVGKSAEAIAEFQAAAAAHVALRGSSSLSGATENPCIDCLTLIHSSAVERHPSLQIYHVRVAAEGDIDYYRCHACGSKLSHEHERNGPSKHWRLL